MFILRPPNGSADACRFPGRRNTQPSGGATARALCFQRCEENRIQPALPPGCGRNSRYFMNDELRELIPPLLIVNGRRDLLRHAVGWTLLGGAKLGG
jgi:hypothetical protein